jgi:3D (Asp-Asp-Asp) domain-containing protein
MIVKLVALGILVATSYRATPLQTKPSCADRHHCETANGENVSELGVAVSQDFLDSGVLHYGDCLYIDGVGFRLVNDCLNRRHKKHIDIFVYTLAEEKRFGVKHLQVWLVSVMPKTKIARRKL